MPEYVDQPVTGDQIAQLTLDVVLKGTAPDETEWVSSLLALSRQAERAGQTGIACTIDEAVQSAHDSGQRLDNARIESVLHRLQSLVPTGSGDAPGSVENPGCRAQSLAQDPELIADFILESREHLDTIEAKLLELEQNAEHLEAIHSIFRSFHTIKGLAGFLELAEVRDVSHEVETVLDLARESKLRIVPAVIDVVLASRDYVAKWLRHLEDERGAPPPSELTANSSLLERIRQLMSGGMDTSAIPTCSDKIAEEPQGEGGNGPAESSKAGSRARVRSVKVDTEKLDYLVDMVGEMVIAQSMVRHDPDLSQLQNPRITRNLAQLTRITDEVQRTAMSMRMVPIGPLFQKMARLSRDLTRKFGKRAAFESSGEDVELDRNIVEELADPLMHMIRNAVDHGIETAEQRAASGKPPQARIQLCAFHRSGHIVIQVSDDGRGIDRDKILKKAHSLGLVSPGSVLTDTECLNLIFHPGFSTAERLSDVSGRGVGMDVVRKQIQKLRGNIEIESRLGSGTTFSLKLPLTLAIIDGLVVRVGEERYIIPIQAIRQVLRPAPKMVKTVENRAEMLVLRDSLVPFIRLYQRFRRASRFEEPSEAVCVIFDVDGRSFAVMVDELVGKQEVVIKSLGQTFQKISGVAGGAILGDGQVGLILDMESLVAVRADV